MNMSVENTLLYLLRHRGRTRRAEGRGATASPLGRYPRKSGTYPSKFENIPVNQKIKIKTFFKDHSYPRRKKEKF